MARPLRGEVAGGLYHVIGRGNERKAVFRDDADRREYLRRLAHYAEKFESRLVAYCLMDNHVHLAIERGKGLLSRIMAGLPSALTPVFNLRPPPGAGLFQWPSEAVFDDTGRYSLLLLL